MFSTSSFAVKATEIFASGINVGVNTTVTNLNGYGGEVHGEKDNKLVGGTIAATVCINDGVTVPCAMTGTERTVISYNEVAQYWPTNTKFAAAQSITVPKDGTQTIDPGVYNIITVEASGKNHGQLIMNPGVYWINEYHIKGQVLPGDANGADPKGTVTLLIKKELDFAGSNNNCNVGSGNIPSTPYQDPSRYVFYTEDLEANVNGACISGYLYFKHELKQAQMDLWGAISAESVTLQKGSHIYVNLEYLIFTDFDTFLEIGPKTSSGWHMVKAPAEINASNPVSVADFFGDDLSTSTFGTEWVVYQRDYDDVAHKSYYTSLTLDTLLEKNRGYWLGLTKDADLKVLGLNPVAWDENIAGCTSKFGCARYTLQSCSTDDKNAYLYDLVGSVASTRSDWKDYRIEVDNNGTLMTPSAARDAGIMNNQIWKYSPSATGTYVTADDSGLTDSAIDYFDGFWVEVNCTNSIGKTIDLIVPNRI